MRHICILLIVALTALTFGCRKDQNSVQNNTANTAVTENSQIKGIIGVSKIIAHPALDAVEKGLQDELIAQGFTGLTFDLQSANGEISTAASISNKFKNEKVLVAVGIATPMALSLANTLRDTPIVFSAVTDPVDAGLRQSNLAEDSLITGVSDMTPVKEQIDLMNRIKKLTTLGHIYNAGEANSVVLMKMLQSICDEMNITLIATTVNNTSEVKQAAEVISARKVDAIYVSTDNVVAAAIGSVTSTADKYGIPVIGADPVTSAGSGALAAYGVDYYKAGIETGKLIAEILKGEKPGNIPVKFMTSPSELELYIDTGVAKRLNLTIDDELLELSGNK